MGNTFVTNWRFRGDPNYNCSSIMPEGPEWAARTGIKEPIIGGYSLAFGIVCEIMYLPCMVALYRETRNSCYKIMFWLSIVDMTALAINSISYGILMIQGSVFCEKPDVIWVLGCFGLGAWCCGCAGCFLLVLNRLCELLNRSRIFAGKRIYYILFGATSYGVLIALFTRNVLFNSAGGAFFFDPYIRTMPANTYVNYVHTANNILIVFLLISLYLALCVVILAKQGAMSTEAGQARTSANAPIFLQAGLICTFNFVAALLYIYVNFFPAPRPLVITGQVAWQLSHGMPPFIYILLNKSVRRNFKRSFGRILARQNSRSSNMTRSDVVR